MGNCQPLYVVGRGSETHTQVAEKLSKISERFFMQIMSE